MNDKLDLAKAVLAKLLKDLDVEEFLVVKEKTTAEILELAREHRRSYECPMCDAPKALIDAFCAGCYRALPPILQSGLWSKFWSDFLPSYVAAFRWLEKNRIPDVEEDRNSELED